MSRDFSVDDKWWEKFISTGSVYDYLEYRDKIDSTGNGINQKVLPGDRGVFCENRGKWNNSQGSGT